MPARKIGSKRPRRTILLKKQASKFDNEHFRNLLTLLFRDNKRNQREPDLVFKYLPKPKDEKSQIRNFLKILKEDPEFLEDLTTFIKYYSGEKIEEAYINDLFYDETFRKKLSDIFCDKETLSIMEKMEDDLNKDIFSPFGELILNNLMLKIIFRNSSRLQKEKVNDIFHKRVKQAEKEFLENFLVKNHYLKNFKQDADKEIKLIEASRHIGEYAQGADVIEQVKTAKEKLEKNIYLFETHLEDNVEEVKSLNKLFVQFFSRNGYEMFRETRERNQQFIREAKAYLQKMKSYLK
jgi:hypothetical protein